MLVSSWDAGCKCRFSLCINRGIPEPSAPKSRDSLRFRRRFLLLPMKFAQFRVCSEKSLANGDAKFWCTQVCAVWEKNLQGLKNWAWPPKFCGTFGVLQNLTSPGFLLCETFCRSFPQKPQRFCRILGNFWELWPVFSGFANSSPR